MKTNYQLHDLKDLDNPVVLDTFIDSGDAAIARAILSHFTCSVSRFQVEEVEEDTIYDYELHDLNTDKDPVIGIFACFEDAEIARRTLEKFTHEMGRFRAYYVPLSK